MPPENPEFISVADALAHPEQNRIFPDVSALPGMTYGQWLDYADRVRNVGGEPPIRDLPPFPVGPRSQIILHSSTLSGTAPWEIPTEDERRPGSNGQRAGVAKLTADMALVHNLVGAGIANVGTRMYGMMTDPHPRQMWALNAETGKPELRPFRIDQYMWNLQRSDLLPDEAYLAWMAGDLDWTNSEWEVLNAIGLVSEQAASQARLNEAGFMANLAAGVAGAGILDPTNFLVGTQVAKVVNLKKLGKVGTVGTAIIGNLAAGTVQELGTAALSNETKSREEALAGIAFGAAFDMVGLAGGMVVRHATQKPSVHVDPQTGQMYEAPPRSMSPSAPPGPGSGSSVPAPEVGRVDIDVRTMTRWRITEVTEEGAVSLENLDKTASAQFMELRGDVYEQWYRTGNTGLGEITQRNTAAAKRKEARKRKQQGKGFKFEEAESRVISDDVVERAVTAGRVLKEIDGRYDDMLLDAAEDGPAIADVIPGDGGGGAEAVVTGGAEFREDAYADFYMSGQTGTSKAQQRAFSAWIPLAKITPRARMEFADNGPVRALTHYAFTTMGKIRGLISGRVRLEAPLERVVHSLRTERRAIQEEFDRQFKSIIHPKLTPEKSRAGQVIRQALPIVQGPSWARKEFSHAIALLELYRDADGPMPTNISGRLQQIADDLRIDLPELERKAKAVYEAAGPASAGLLSAERLANRHAAAVIRLKENVGFDEMVAIMRELRRDELPEDPSLSQILAPFTSDSSAGPTWEEIRTDQVRAAEHMRRHFNKNWHDNVDRKTARRLLALGDYYNLDYGTAITRTSRAIMQLEALAMLRRFESDQAARMRAYGLKYPVIADDGAIPFTQPGQIRWDVELGDTVRTAIDRRLEKFIDHANNYAGDTEPGAGEGHATHKGSRSRHHRRHGREIEDTVRLFRKMIELDHDAPSPRLSYAARLIRNLTTGTRLVRSGVTAIDDLAHVASQIAFMPNVRPALRALGPGMNRIKRLVQSDPANAPALLRKLKFAYDGVNARIQQLYTETGHLPVSMEGIDTDALAIKGERAAETLANVTGLVGGLQPVSDYAKDISARLVLAELQDIVPRVHAAIETWKADPSGRSLNAVLAEQGLELNTAHTLRKFLSDDEIRMLADAYEHNFDDFDGIRIPKGTAPPKPDDSLSMLLTDMPTTRKRLEERLYEQMEQFVDVLGQEEFAPGEVANLRAEANELDFTTAFRGSLPTEVKEAIEGEPELRFLLRANQAGGTAEDYILRYGTDAWIERLHLMTKAGKLRKAIELAHGFPDPEVQFAAYLLDKMHEEGAGSMSLRAIEVSQLQEGTEFSIGGEPFLVRVRRDDPSALEIASQVSDSNTFMMPEWSEIAFDKGSLKGAKITETELVRTSKARKAATAATAATAGTGEHLAARSGVPADSPDLPEPQAVRSDSPASRPRRPGEGVPPVLPAVFIDRDAVSLSGLRPALEGRGFQPDQVDVLADVIGQVAGWNPAVLRAVRFLNPELDSPRQASLRQLLTHGESNLEAGGRPGGSRARAAIGIDFDELTAHAQAVVSIFETGNLESVVHEQGHLVRFLLSDEDLSVAGKHYLDPESAGSGKWTRAAEEAFARDWVEYLRRGPAVAVVPPAVRKVFSRLRAALLRLYAAVKGGGIKRIRIHPDVQHIFDRWLAGTEAANLTIDEVTRRLQRSHSMLRDLADGEARQVQARYERMIDSVAAYTEHRVETEFVITPHTLDKPVSSDNPVVAALLTFQSWPLAATNQLMLRGIQRPLARQASLLASMFGYAAVGMFLRALLRGEDADEWIQKQYESPGVFVSDVVSYSGVLGVGEKPVQFATDLASGDSWRRQNAGVFQLLPAPAAYVDLWRRAAIDTYERISQGREYTEAEARRLHQIFVLTELLPFRMVGEMGRFLDLPGFDNGRPLQTQINRLLGVETPEETKRRLAEQRKQRADAERN